MDVWQTPEFVYGIGALVLVLSALTIRKMGLWQIVKGIMAWVLIFAVIFVAFSFRYELEPYWLRVKGELTGETAPISSGGEVRLRMRADNHFHAQALINGRSVDMMIDTGATFTAMGTAKAEELGIAVDKTAFGHEMRTANGSIKAYPAKIARLQVGDIEMRDVTVFVADEFGEVAVLGMNFLTPLKSWRVEGQEMILVP